MEYNEIGKISTTHALKGEVKVKTDSSFIKERFKVGNILYYKENDQYIKLTVKSHRSMQGYELVSFEGFDDINKVMPLINKTLYGEKNRDLLKEGQNYYSDYIGLNCMQFNEVKGKVKDVVSYPHSDYLLVKTNDNKEKLVPLLKEFIKDVNLDKNIVVIDDIEGLL